MLPNWLSATQINTWHVDSIRSFPRRVRKTRKLEFWKFIDTLLSAQLDSQFCSRVETYIRCFPSVSIIISDWLATKYKQSTMPWLANTVFCLSSKMSFQQPKLTCKHVFLVDFLAREFPADCFFNSPSWTCKNVFLVEFLTRAFSADVFPTAQAELAKTCFSWTFLHENFQQTSFQQPTLNLQKRVSRGLSGTRISLVMSLITLQFSQPPANHAQVRHKEVT